MAQESETIRRIVVAFGEAWRQSVSEVTIRTYEVGLEGLSEEELQAVAKRALQQCKFMPSPAELRGLAGYSHERAAIDAWAMAQRASTVSYMADLDFEDRTTNAVIRSLGGRDNFFSRFNGVESEKWLRKEFLDTYKALSASTPSEEAAYGPLFGHADRGEVKGRKNNRITVVVVGRTGIEKARGLDYGPVQVDEIVQQTSNAMTLADDE